MLKAVIFDLDDTLIDWSGVNTPWNTIIAEQIGPVVEHYAQQGHQLHLNPVVETYLERMRDAWLSTRPPEWRVPNHRLILADSLMEHGMPAEALDMEEIYARIKWGLAPGVRTFPDTLDVLNTLRSHNLKLGLLTNAAQPMSLRDLELEAVGIRDYFDVRLSAGDVGTLKPHPRPFRIVLEKLGVTPEETFYVGDRPHDDVRGAQAAGMRAIWLRRPHSQRLTDAIRPNAIVDSLMGVLETMDMWFPNWRQKVIQ